MNQFCQVDRAPAGSVRDLFLTAESVGHDQGVRRSRPLVADAGLSVVLPALQKGRVFRPLAPGSMHLRHGRTDGVFLQSLCELAYVSDDVLALHGLFFEAGHPGRRIPALQPVLEVAQSRCP